MIYIGFIL